MASFSDPLSWNGDRQCHICHARGQKHRSVLAVRIKFDPSLLCQEQVVGSLHRLPTAVPVPCVQSSLP